MLTYPRNVLLTPSPKAGKVLNAKAVLVLEEVRDAEGNSSIECVLDETPQKYEVIECPSGDEAMTFGLQPPVIFFAEHPGVSSIASNVKKRDKKVKLWAELLQILLDEHGDTFKPARIVSEFLFDPKYTHARQSLIGKIREYSTTKTGVSEVSWGIRVKGHEGWQLASPALVDRLARELDRGVDTCSICGEEAELGAKFPDFKAQEIRPYSFNMKSSNSYGACPKNGERNTPICAECTAKIADANVSLTQKCKLPIAMGVADAYVWDAHGGPAGGGIHELVDAAIHAADLESHLEVLKSLGVVFYMDVVYHDARASIRFESQSTGSDIADRIQHLRQFMHPHILKNSKTGERFVGSISMLPQLSVLVPCAKEATFKGKISGGKGVPINIPGILAGVLSSIHGFVDAKKSSYTDALTRVYRYIYAGERMDPSTTKHLADKILRNVHPRYGLGVVDDIHRPEIQFTAVNAISEERVDMVVSVRPELRRLLVNAAYLLSFKERQRMGKSKKQQSLMEIYRWRLKRDFFATFVEIFPSKGLDVRVGSDDPYLTDGINTIREDLMMEWGKEVMPTENPNFNTEFWGGFSKLFNGGIEIPPTLNKAEWVLFVSHYNMFSQWDSKAKILANS
jgi:hypothetical protein